MITHFDRAAANRETPTLEQPMVTSSSLNPYKSSSQMFSSPSVEVTQSYPAVD